MFALPISMPRFKSIIFLSKIALKLSYFCKKCKIFERWGLRPQILMPQSLAKALEPPDATGFAHRPPLASGGWGSALRSPKQPRPLRVSG